MRLTILFLLISTPAFADGVLVLGAKPDKTIFGIFTFGGTLQERRDKAIADCQKHANDCRIHQEFSEPCGVSLKANDGTILFMSSETIDKGLNTLLPKCEKHGGCTEAATGCQ